MRHLALILVAGAFALGSLATAQAACDGVTHTVQTKTKETVASAGGSSTPVTLPQPKSGS